MSFLEWIFGKDHEASMKAAGDKCLERIQLAVDAFHGQMLDICGSRREECEDCWNEIPEGDEFLFSKCPNYKKRCKAKDAMHESCKSIMMEYERDMDKAFIESFNFIFRPLARCYVACGGMKRARKRMQMMSETVSKMILTAILAGAFLAGPFLALDCEAAYHSSKKTFQMKANQSDAKSAGYGVVVHEAAVDSTVEEITSEIGYDAVIPSNKQMSIPAGNENRSQKSEKPARRCKCQGN